MHVLDSRKADIHKRTNPVNKSNVHIRIKETQSLANSSQNTYGNPDGFDLLVETSPDCSERKSILSKVVTASQPELEAAETPNLEEGIQDSDTIEDEARNLNN